MWWTVFTLVASAALSYVLRPKPPAMQHTAPTPAGIGEIDFPTAQAGRAIPVLFGSRWLSGPNVVWYGDLRTTPIQETTCGGGKK